jgi:hypothetical protein
MRCANWSCGFFLKFFDDGVPILTWVECILRSASYNEIISMKHNQPTNQLFGEFGIYNFHLAIKNPSLIVIACVNPRMKNLKDQYLAAVRAVARASNSDAKHALHGSFVFGHMDGVKFAQFLSQYNVKPDRLPRLIVLDSANRMFYEDHEVCTHSLIHSLSLSLSPAVKSMTCLSLQAMIYRGSLVLIKSHIAKTISLGKPVLMTWQPRLFNCLLIYSTLKWRLDLLPAHI